MRRILAAPFQTIILLLALGCSPSNAANKTCETGWKKLGTHCYWEINPRSDSFGKAKAYCEAIGARLPELEKYPGSRDWNTIIRGLHNRAIWMGLTTREHSSVSKVSSWRWYSSDKKAVNLAWSGNSAEPTGGYGCAALIQGELYNNRACDTNRVTHVLCQYDVESEPVSGSNCAVGWFKASDYCYKHADWRHVNIRKAARTCAANGGGLVEFPTLADFISFVKKVGTIGYKKDMWLGLLARNDLKSQYNTAWTWIINGKLNYSSKWQWNEPNKNKTCAMSKGDKNFLWTSRGGNDRSATVMCQYKTNAEKCSKCEKDWITTSYGCIFFGRTRKSFAKAEQECKDLGSWLPAFNSTAQYHEFLSWVVPVDMDTFWIGLKAKVDTNMSTVKAAWEWSDGTELQMEFMNQGGDPDPISMNKNPCIYVKKESTFRHRWNMDPCKAERHVFCQKSHKEQCTN